MDATSHTAVHPFGMFAGGGAAGNNNNHHPQQQQHRMRPIKELQGMPGTVGGLALRVGQVGFAACAFSVMIRVKDFATITAFCYLVASMVLQFSWSLSLAIVDVRLLLKRTTLQNSVILTLCVVGDWITATLTFAAACASSGIAVLIDRDLKACGSQCAKYETAAAMTFLTWLMVSPSFFFAFWLLATR